MKLSVVFGLLVALMLLFHIPTWMLLIHNHNPRTDVLDSATSSRESEAPIANVPNFFLGYTSESQVLSTREQQPFDDDFQKSIQADGDEKHVEDPQSSLVLVELAPEDGLHNTKRCANCTVAVLFCLDCTARSGLPWHILSRASVWFKNFNEVEVIIVTRLSRIYSIAREEDSDIVDRLVDIGLDPNSLVSFPDTASQLRISFRIFSLQQRGRPCTLSDCQRYAWDSLFRISLRVSEKSTPVRIIFIAPGFFPADDSFAEGITSAERNESIVSCAVSGPQVDDYSTLLHDGFEIFSGQDDKPTVYPRFPGLVHNSPRLFATRSTTLFFASPICFSVPWKTFLKFWPSQQRVEPRPDGSLRDDLKSFWRFSFSAAMTTETIASAASARAQEARTQNERGWLSRIESLNQPAECGSGLSPTDRCREAAEKRWGARIISSRQETFLEWETFCIPCFGFTNEVMHFVKPLEDRVSVHMPMNSDCFCPGTPQYFSDSISRITMEKPFEKRWKDGNGSYVFVSHKDPGSFTNRNPRPDVVVGRSMYEFNVLPANWLPHKADADEIWVPSRFVRWVFEKNGFSKSRLLIIPEPIDVFFFDPLSTRPLSLPFAHGYAPWRRSTNIHVSASPSKSNETVSGLGRVVERKAAAGFFKFFSVFKWESRKGPDLLLQAYFQSFTNADRVSLYLVSYIYGDATRNPVKIMSEVKRIFEQVHSGSSVPQRWPEDAPHVEVIGDQLPESILASLYRSVDCFVFPTRGEGWGLPIIQAMSMGLATIATNFSGNVDFLTAENSYLIPIEGVEPLPDGSPYGNSPNKSWAVLSVERLSSYMLYASRNVQQTKAVGRRARRDVIAQYSEDVIGEVVLERLRQIINQNKLSKKFHESQKKLHEFLDDHDAHLVM
jgi:glycosyltransferase involved in cell wall biosynthesis